MAVNYDDKRFDQVETDKQQALSDLEQTYAGMMDQSGDFYQQQIDASKEWADKQSQLQQEQTDFTIQQIEQQKEQAHKDYIKEQSGAYTDWQKQSDQYGVNAEQMASAGMTNTGYSESSQVAMYTAYQNRVAAAREAVNLAMLNYNNGIKEAQLQNNSILAEIHAQALEQQLKLALEGFQYKNSLLLELTNKKTEVDNEYWNRYLSVLDQINTENAFAEEQRQFNATYELQQKEFEEQVRQFNESYNLKVKEFNEQVRQYNQSYNEQVRQFNEEIARLKAKDAQEHAAEIQRLEFQKEQLAEQKRQFDAEVKLKQQQLAEEKRQFDAQQAAKSGKLGGSGSGSSGSGSSPSYSSPKRAKPANSSKKVNQSTSKTSNYQSAYSYISAMISAGKSKNQVLSEIAIAQKAGALTAAEAAKLKAVFNPRGHQYT